MHRQIRILMSLSFAALLAGVTSCKRPPETQPQAPSPAPTNTVSSTSQTGNTFHLDHAQPKLPTLSLYLGPREITAEIARSRTEISTGMMFRESMGTNEGMLFVFPMAHQTGFYMKNTILPLSVAYIDREGAILEINDLEPLNENPVESKSDQVQYVLEMNLGWFKTNQIGVGTVITTSRGTLKETFFPRRF